MAIPSLAAEAIIFSINSAIKLSANLRRAYVHSIRAKALVLPLPDFNTEIQLATINLFFFRHQEYLDQLIDLKELFEKANSVLALEEDDMEEYLKLYRTFKAIEDGDTARLEMNTSEVLTLLKIRQWEKGQAPTSVLQLVAGTLVEIGVDYFAQVPGALNPDSVQGRLMRKFLNAFDGISLVDNPDIKKDLSSRLVPRLFSAAAESLAELSTEIAGDEKVQAFIQVTAQGIANDIFQRASKLDPEQREEAIHWGQLVLRSMIRNAGNYVLSAPESLFGTNEAVSEIIKSSGLVLLEAILDDDSGKVAFKNALNPTSLDRLARAALSVIAEHPNVISGERGIKEIIGAVAAVAKEKNVSEKGFLPELARMVLEQSAGRLELFWRETPQGAEHLLVVALSQTLQAFSDKPEDKQWKPALSKTQLLGIVEELLEVVAQNPAWVLDKVHDQSALAEVLEAIFGALKKLPKGERLTTQSLNSILRIGMQTALVNRRVLDKVHWGADQQETTVLTKALDLVFACAFPKDGAANISRLKLLADLLNYASKIILQQHPDENGLILLDLILFNSEIDYSQGFDARFADQILDAALGALAARPELLVKPEALRSIISGVAAAMDNTRIKQAGLLSKLIQVILQQTAQHANLLLNAPEEKPQHLLLIALGHILNGLAASDGSGQWKPGLSPALAEELIEDLLDAVVRNPAWVALKGDKNAFITEILQTVLKSLGSIPTQERVSPENLRHVIQLSLISAASSPVLLQKIKYAEDDQEKEILCRALELLFAYVFNPAADKAYRKLIQKDLIAYVLKILISRAPDARGLILLELILSEDNGIDLSQGFQTEPLDRLADTVLTILARHPELVTHDQELKNVVTNIASALHNSGLDQPGLLPELIRLTLAQLANRMELLLDGDRAFSRHLLFLAGSQVLSALAQPAEEGRWKPKLSNEQILEILGTMYKSVLENPQWTQQGAIIFDLLDAIFRALDKIPDHLSIPYALVRSLVDKAIEAATRQRKLLVSIQTPLGRKELYIQSALEGFFLTLYQGQDQEETVWYLSQMKVLDPLLDHFLGFLSTTMARQEDIDAALDQLRKAVTKWKENFSQNLRVILEEFFQVP